MLDYGKAVLEGAVQGIVGATTDCLEHPIQTALCVAVGEYVLAYQLCKVVFNVAEIGLTSLVNPKHGAQKWNDYIAPISMIINAITNKKLSSYDMVRGVTQFTTHCIAQGAMLKGLRKFYENTKTKALDFIEKNPLASPEEYLITPEGSVLKVAGKPDLDNLKAAKIGEQLSSKGGGKNHGRNINKNQKKIQDSTNRIVNKISKTEFFDGVNDRYQQIGKTGVYRLKDGCEPIIKDAKYLSWDSAHNEVEAWKSKTNHLGALDPAAKTLYKGPATDGRTLNI